jgi:hypothetical protein
MAVNQEKAEALLSHCLEDDKFLMLILGIFLMFMGYLISCTFAPVARWRWFIGILLIFTGVFFLCAKNE